MMLYSLSNAATNAIDTPNTGKETNKSSPIPGAIYSYTDIHFDSSVGNQFNRFSGHSNLYGVVGENFKLPYKISAAVALFKVDTQLNSQVKLFQSPLTLSEQKIKNYTLFGHVLKQFNPNFLGDLSGGYGHNRISNISRIDPNGLNNEIGISNIRSNDWFVSLSGIYIKPIQKFTFTARLRALYSQVNNDESNLWLQNAQFNQPIPSVANKILFIIENGRIAYKARDNIYPFINASLIQVAHHSISRPVINPVISGSLPQLEMDENGFKIGGGISIFMKNCLFKIEQQYYNSANTFTSNQTVASIRYLLD